MAREFHEYTTIAIHSNLASFKGWLQGHLRATIENRIHLPDNCYRGGNQHWEYVVHGRLISIKIDHKTAEDIELTFFADNPTTKVDEHIEQLVQIIQKRWSTVTLPYSFKNLVKSSVLAHILEERWQESIKTFQAEAYLSTTIILGSILEGILLYSLEQNKMQALHAEHAPENKKTRKVKALNEWTLNNMIEVAHECGWLIYDIHKYAHVLRNYRNLIHPTKQIQLGESGRVGEEVCRLSREIVAGTLSQLIKST